MTVNVQGWKVNIEPYQYLTTGVDDGEVVHVKKTFDVVESLAGLCFSKGLELDVDGMFYAKKIADKIRAAGKAVIFDEKEMAHIRAAYALLRGLPETFVEFLERIRDAQKIELIVPQDLPPL